MKKLSLIIQFCLPLLMLFSMLAQPSPALALEVLSVQPSTILNTTEVSLVVTGTGLPERRHGRPEAWGRCYHIYQPHSAQRRSACRAAPGVYTVTVFNPDSTSASLENA